MKKMRAMSQMLWNMVMMKICRENKFTTENAKVRTVFFSITLIISNKVIIIICANTYHVL